jgi:hypothetical protein
MRMPLIPPEDYFGQTLGNWTVLSLHSFRKTHNGTHLAFVNARCKCGTIKSVRLNSLKTGHPETCGCGRRNAENPVRDTNGKTVPSYDIWLGIRKRCFNPKHRSYKDYGGRGITVCDRWLGKQGFANFREDMGPRPSLQHEVDRYPDNNGNYEPGNCRWATVQQNSRNRRSNTLITMFGETKCLAAWVECLDVAHRRNIAWHWRHYGQRGVEELFGEDYVRFWLKRALSHLLH